MDLQAILQEKSGLFEIDKKLEAKIKKRTPEVGTLFSFCKTQSQLTPPKITIANMDWALEYLNEINEENLEGILQQISNHKKSYEALQVALSKYE